MGKDFFQSPVGTEEGMICNRSDCIGLMEYPLVVNCACHINPPCSQCVDNKLTCTICGYESYWGDE